MIAGYKNLLPVNILENVFADDWVVLAGSKKDFESSIAAWKSKATNE